MQINQIFKLQELISQLGAWLLALIPIVSGLMIAYHYMMKAAAQDEAAAAQHTKSIRSIAMSAAVGMAAMSLVKFLLTFVDSAAIK